MFDLQWRHPLAFENISLPDSPSSSSGFTLSPFMVGRVLSAEAVRTRQVGELRPPAAGRPTSALTANRAEAGAKSGSLPTTHGASFAAEHTHVGHASTSSLNTRLTPACSEKLGRVAVRGWEISI